MIHLRAEDFFGYAKYISTQFIIATHSPLLMAFPGAAIYSLDGGRPHRVAWAELEHVSLTRDFLNDPELFLRQLSA